MMLLGGILVVSAFAQKPSGSDGNENGTHPTMPAKAAVWVDTLKDIYGHMDYKTAAYDDLNEMWIITDSYLVRNVFNRLLNGGAITHDGLTLDEAATARVLDEIYDGSVRFRVTRRAIDDEIDALELVGSSMNVDAVRDWVHILDLLETDTYSQVKQKDYSHSDITKQQYDSAPRSSFDIYLNAFNPEIMLWHSGAEQNGEKEHYTVSAFGCLGNDALDLPFWFKSSMVAGLQLNYQDKPTFFDRKYEKYTIQVGIEQSINFSTLKGDDPSPNSLLKDRKLQGSGTNVYLGGTLVPSLSWPGKGSYLELALQASLAIEEKEKYQSTVPDTFYSIRNYIGLSGKLKHINGLFDLGAGVTWHDVSHYACRVPREKTLERIGPIQNNFLPFVEVGISQDGTLLQYGVSAQLNYDVSRGYGFYVIKSSLVLNNCVGIDLRYFKALRSDNLPTWHYGDYIAVSPVIRINY
jgi:hypothetical protein